MSSRWARVARGWTAAGFATFVAALSHTLAGGAAPGVVAILVTLVISGAVCTLLAGRTLSTWRLAASIALSQALFHGVFSGLGMPVAPRGAHHTVVLPVFDATITHPHAGAAMWLAHAAAALVTVIAFRHAERAFWGLADTARLLLARMLDTVIPVCPATLPALASGVCRNVPHDLTVLLSSMRHRGPPMELTAA